MQPVSKKDQEIINDEAALLKEAEEVICNNGDLEKFLAKVKHKDVILRGKLCVYLLKLLDDHSLTNKERGKR